MIYLFDADGTLIEPWYGKTGPDFFQSEKDRAVRFVKRSDMYDHNRRLDHVHWFIEKAKALDPKARFGVLTRISNVNEFKQKKIHIMRNFDDIDHDLIFGTVSESDKLEMIKLLLEEDDMIYVDDSISTINLINDWQAKEILTKHPGYHVLCIHAMSLLVRDPDEILSAHAAYRKWLSINPEICGITGNMT